MKKITRIFLQGLLILVPLVITVYVIYFIFIKIDSLFPFKIPGLGFAATIIIIFIIGFAASNFLTRKIVGFVDLIFTRLPLIKMIYSALKDLINAFVGDRRNFDTPVLIRLSKQSNLQAIGFMTRSNLKNIGLGDRIAVYLPQSFNFAGNLLIVPKNQIEPLDMDPSDAMTLVVSGGISSRKNNIVNGHLRSR